MFRIQRLVTLLALMACTVGVTAAEHVVQGVVTQWKPLVTFAMPGDTIRFKNMTGHDTQVIDGMLPDGAEPWKSKLGEESFTVTLEKEGAYVFKCNPHITTGMVGVVVIGDAKRPANFDDLVGKLGTVKVGKNMVNRALKKLDKALMERE